MKILSILVENCLSVSLLEKPERVLNFIPKSPGLRLDIEDNLNPQDHWK